MSEEVELEMNATTSDQEIKIDVRDDVTSKESNKENFVSGRKRSQSSDASEGDTLLSGTDDDKFEFDYEYPRPIASTRKKEGEDNAPTRQRQFTAEVPRWPCLCLCGREIGRMTVCCELPKSKDNKRRILCMIGACWPISIMWVFVILFVPTTIWLIFWTQLPLPVFITGIVFQFLTLISFCCTAFVDPGIFPRYTSIPKSYKSDDTQDDGEGGPSSLQQKIPPRHKRWRYSDEANGWRPAKVNWDRESQVLIERVDHFCPIIGHTIARRNMMAFHSLLCMHSLLCYYLIVITIIGIMKYADVF